MEAVGWGLVFTGPLYWVECVFLTLAGYMRITKVQAKGVSHGLRGHTAHVANTKKGGCADTPAIFPARCSYSAHRVNSAWCGALLVRVLSRASPRCSYTIRTAFATRTLPRTTRRARLIGNRWGLRPCSLKRLSCPSISPAPRTTPHHGRIGTCGARTPAPGILRGYFICGVENENSPGT